MRGHKAQRAGGLTHLRPPQVSDASSVLSSLLLHDLLLTSAAGRTFLILSSSGVGASWATCPGLVRSMTTWLAATDARAIDI